MSDTLDNLKDMVPGYSNMFPSEHTDESRVDMYNHDKALAYWLKIEPDEFISCLSMELLSINGHVKAYTRTWLDLSSEMPDNKDILSQFMQSICSTQPRINYLLDAVYIYAANREKQKRFVQGDKSLIMQEMRLPTGHDVYIEDIPRWYKKDPLEFLSVITPIVWEKISNSYTLVKKILIEPDLDKIILSTIILSNGKKNIITFELIVQSLYKTYSILNEGLFLISSYAQNYKNH